MAREAAYVAFRKLDDEKLFGLADSLCSPDAIRRTDLIEFSDLTSVDHKSITEVRSLGPGGWPGYLPESSSEPQCRGFVFLGFLRRGMPVQHTEARLVSGDRSIELTRMEDNSESMMLALLLLDTVWQRCMKYERELIPRPFWLGEGGEGGELPERGAPPGDIFWQEFLGARGANLNPDWELFTSRCQLAESVKATRLWRDGRSEGGGKWSEERALLAKLCSRLAFSHLSIGWLPQDAQSGPDDRGGMCIGKGPFQIEFEFQERVLKSQEQAKRVEGLRRRAGRVFEESAAASREHDGNQKVLRTRDLRRLALVPETYLGLLDPALDNLDQKSRRRKKSEGTLLGEERSGLTSLLKPTGIALVLALAVAALTHYLTPLDQASDFALFSGALLLALLLGAWSFYVAMSTGRSLRPSVGAWRVAKTFIAGVGSAAGVVAMIAAIGDGPLWPSLAVAVLGLLVCLAIGVFPRPIYWFALLIATFVGLAYLVPNLANTGLAQWLFEPWDWGEALGFEQEHNEEDATGLFVIGFALFLLSVDLAFMTSKWRQETVVIPTWSGSSDWPAFEIRTPPEFSVWQGIIARPSRRNRGWRTRTAVEVGRKAHFWWSDPRDRGHVPPSVPDRPQLLILELRARMTGTITILGSALSFATAVILLGVGLKQLGGGDGVWEPLQDAGGDAVTTILLLVPTLLGALLIRPGEEPIAGQLLRADRLLVLFGAILPAGIAAAALLFTGWPDGKTANQVKGLWELWIYLGTLSILAGLTLLLSWLDSRKIDRPQPFNRQQGLPVSEPRRRNLDYPAPLPPLESVWGRVFARRSLLRLSPRRGLLRHVVTTDYSLVLPAEGSRVYTPAAPTILCLLKPSAACDDPFWDAVERNLVRSEDEGVPVPLGPRSGLATNIIEWDPAASLSLLTPHYLETGHLKREQGKDDDLERFQTTLLRLQRANSRPNERKPIGSGGGVVVSTLPRELGSRQQSDDVSDDVSDFFEAGRLKALVSAFRRRRFLELITGAAPSSSKKRVPSVNLLGAPPAEHLDLPSVDQADEQEDDERQGKIDRLMGILDRASLDFDALLIVDPKTLDGTDGSDGRVEVLVDRWATRHVSSRAAELARVAGRGPGVHVWPSSFEPPLCGESLFPIRAEDHGEKLDLARRILLLTRVRNSRLLRPLRRLVFNRGMRTIPVARVVRSKAKREGSKREGSSARLGHKLWSDWVRDIPRALDSRPPIPPQRLTESGEREEEDKEWVYKEWVRLHREAGNDPHLLNRKRLLLQQKRDEASRGRARAIREFGHNPVLLQQKRAEAKDPTGNRSDPLKVVLMSGNIASGKSWMMHRLRDQLARRSEEWDAVRVDSTNNFFFANQDVFEGDGIEAITSSYHLDTDDPVLAVAYQGLIQQAFLVESWDVLGAAIDNTRHSQEGLLVEYWPMFSTRVMSASFLDVDEHEKAKKLAEKLRDRVIEASAEWEKSKRWNHIRWKMLHLQPKSLDELEERVRARSRRLEEIDPAELDKVEEVMKDLFLDDLAECLSNLSNPAERLPWAPEGYRWSTRPAVSVNVKMGQGELEWQLPSQRIFVANLGPKPEGEELDEFLDRVIKEIGRP